MKIAISGSYGLIGSALRKSLLEQGHEILRLVRRAAGASGEVAWDPTSERTLYELEGIDAVVHLAGENVGSYWTAEKKQRIRSSRVDGTQTLVRSLGRLSAPPASFLCASAIGYYGSRPATEVLTEDSAVGQGFLADVCRDWEAACDPLRVAGVRVVSLRFGVVLSPLGGALRQMLPPFKLGLGGPLGDGRQVMSWIAVDDAVEAISFLLRHPESQGPFNLVAPQPVTQRYFAHALGQALRRPSALPLPAWLLRLLLGGMADEVLLAGARVHPQRLLEAGFRFDYTGLEAALQHLLFAASTASPGSFLKV